MNGVTLGGAARRVARAVWFREGRTRRCLVGPYAGLTFELCPQLHATRLAVFYRAYEPPVTELLRRRLRPGALVYDVGAHVGIHALYMAKLLRGRGRIVAFEAWAANHAVLQRHIARNAPLADIIVPVHLAVGRVVGTVGVVEGATDGTHRLARSAADDVAHPVGGACGAPAWRAPACGAPASGVPARTAGRRRDGAAHRLRRGSPVGRRHRVAVGLHCVRRVRQARRVAHPVGGTTLDAYDPSARPDLVLVDVEGAELDVLEGAAELVARARPEWVLEHHGGAAAARLVAWLGAHGYRVDEVGGRHLHAR